MISTYVFGMINFCVKVFLLAIRVQCGTKNLAISVIIFSALAKSGDVLCSGSDDTYIKANI
jgi:hypothetical protein